jgi:hypothetical protein
MSLQVIKDSNGIDSGVFIPIDEWKKIKDNYPDVENIDDEIPDWQKKILNERLLLIKSNPELIKPISDLFKDL